jgi:hypothetical protein
MCKQMQDNLQKRKKGGFDPIDLCCYSQSH